MSLHINRRGVELKTTPMAPAEEVPGAKARASGLALVRVVSNGVALAVRAGSRIPTIGALTIRAEAKARVTGHGRRATTVVARVLTRPLTKVKELRKSRLYGSRSPEGAMPIPWE